MRNASPAPIACLNSTVTASLLVGARSRTNGTGVVSGANVPWAAAFVARTCSGCASENEPLTRWPGLAPGSATASVRAAGARRRGRRDRARVVLRGAGDERAERRRRTEPEAQRGRDAAADRRVLRRLRLGLAREGRDARDAVDVLAVAEDLHAVAGELDVIDLAAHVGLVHVVVQHQHRGAFEGPEDHRVALVAGDQRRHLLHTGRRACPTSTAPTSRRTRGCDCGRTSRA